MREFTELDGIKRKVKKSISGKPARKLSCKEQRTKNGANQA
jgi:hypothetical protein